MRSSRSVGWYIVLEETYLLDPRNKGIYRVIRRSAHQRLVLVWTRQAVEVLCVTEALEVAAAYQEIHFYSMYLATAWRGGSPNKGDSTGEQELVSCCQWRDYLDEIASPTPHVPTAYTTTWLAHIYWDRGNRWWRVPDGEYLTTIAVITPRV